MQASKDALSLIREFEGFRASPYADIGGKPTIGYGFTHYADGRTVTMNDAAISRQAADALLPVLANGVAAAVLKIVTVPLTQGQLDALVSFAYNLGVHALAESTLLKLLNARHYESAALEFVKWDHEGKVEVDGLLRRRKAEQHLFLGLS
jgi:lysozyme